ncbi:MAG: PAS domain S-box protein [Candidatus Methanofastidiosa archaeon]|nr:PAS domain S-box protein [Candidatus Methanofastidiosa archaeon]
MQLTVYQIPLLLSSLLSLLLISLLIKRKRTPTTNFLSLFLASIFIWSFADFFNLLSVTLSSKMFFGNVSYFGVTTFSSFLILFVLEYTGKSEFVNRYSGLLFVIPIITIILVWTNEYHHLVRQSIYLENISGLLAFGKVYGTWFWVQFAYNHFLVIISTLLLLYALGITRNIYRKQVIIFLTGIFVPWISNLLYVFRIISFPIDMTSVSFTFTGLVLFWGITREHLLDIVPTAYSAVFNDIPDGVIILGGNNQIVDLNPAAEDIFKIKVSDMRGKKFQEILAYWKELKDFYNNHISTDDYHGVISREDNYYDIAIKIIYDKKNQSLGKLIVLHDITKRRKMEKKLKESNKQIEDLNDTLQIINKILRHDLLNKLTVMKSALSLYEENKDSAFLNSLDHSIDNSVHLIERIRDLESFVLNKEELKPIRVRKTLEEVSKAINFPITIDGDATVLADEALFSVFENILRNAIIHGKTDKIDIEIKSKDNNSNIRIIDYGKGVPDTIKGKIFEEGISYGKEKGSGLGLFIVRRTIDRYGGNIKVEDNKPNGTIFTIKLKQI